MNDENSNPVQVEALLDKNAGVSARSLLTPTNILLGLAALASLSIVYYFVFALPQIKRDALSWEKEKYKQEEEAKQAQEAQKAEMSAMYDICVGGAERDYWVYIKLNGQAIAKKPGTYSAPVYVWDAADRKKKAALDECYRQYRQ